MHEFSIAEGLVKAVLTELSMQPPKARLVRAKVVMGDLHQIVPEYLEQAYQILTAETRAAGSELRFESRPVVVRCRLCGWSGAIALPYFTCASCQSTSVDMTSGKELHLDSLEIELPEGTV